MTENVCPSCGTKFDPETPDRVSVYGMYDLHLFHRVQGASVDEVIENWLEHISQPIPAIVGEKRVDDLGPSSLCPAIVCCGSKELRRVGDMVFPDYPSRKPRDPKALEAYREALKADPDVERLLANCPA